MTPERWERVKALFDEAAAIEPDKRSGFLASISDDPELRAEVESLLAADDPDATLLERPVGEILSEMLPEGPTTGRHFGPYRTVREVGRGGMAVVYAAVRDDDQYRKQVAIKLIKRGMDTDTIVARFLKERQILANLEHPNIARLLDGGMTEDGLPYLVMEYVEGEPIDRYCDHHRLSTEARLELFRTVCAAVHFAHQNLVVHRDLKPSNILVDHSGAPKLLDFGIAKLLASDRPAPPVTVDGMRPMTPEYASPEQIRNQPVTTSSDTYALGVLLYILLTGQRPYRLRSRTPAEIEQAVCEREPVRPSTALEASPDTEAGDARTPAEQVSRSRGLSPTALRRKLSGDLDNIILMAMQKTPERRYGSVEQLSEDIRRHLAGMPVIARPDVLTYRVSKFVGRHRWGVAAALLIMLSLVAGIVATAWQYRVADRARVTAEEVSNLLISLFESSWPDRSLGETITARELLDQGAHRISRELRDQPETRAELMDSIGQAYFKLGLYPEALPRLEEALELRQQTFGEQHLAVAESKNNLGELWLAQGRFKDSAKLHGKALEIRLGLLGESHGLVAESLNNLAVALHQQGKHSEAEPLLRRSLELRQRELGAEHTKVAYALNNLALVLKEEQKYDEAEEMARRALVMNQRLLAEGHPDLAVNLNNLAEILRVQEKCEEAIALFEWIIDQRTKVLGGRHPGLATTQNNLAGCLVDLGRYEEAEEYFRTSMDLRRETLGPENPAVAASLNNVARIFYERQQYEVAEDFYRQALSLHRKAHGEEHQAVATNLANLARVLEKRRDMAAAEPMFREALAISRRLLDEDHPTVLERRHRLANFLLNVGKMEQAEGQFRAEVAARLQVAEASGEDQAAQDLARAQLGLARALMASGRAETAEPVFRQALDIWRRWPTEEWLMLGGTKSLLGNCLASLERFEEAEELLLESYMSFEQRQGPEHPITQRALRRVVALYRDWQRPELEARYRQLLKS
ncbi:MAG: serine/threonine-protein kinase [Acidobacteriota bacterium]